MSPDMGVREDRQEGNIHQRKADHDEDIGRQGQMHKGDGTLALESQKSDIAGPHPVMGGRGIYVAGKKG